MDIRFFPESEWPVVIQGGMGIGVSNWRLARAVARAGQLGVVSGTAVGALLTRRLQEGDHAGDLRRALAACPLRAAARRVLADWFIPGGLPAGASYRLTPLYSLGASPGLSELTAVAAFVEVFLAKEGHAGAVGLNLLEKIQLATLPTLYGAMLAGVDYVLMGAGIPRAIPGVLDAFAAGRAAALRIDVAGEPPESAGEFARLDPAELNDGGAPVLRRPRFLAVVSSSTVALTLARKASGRVDGFVVEGASAGGHNAPPRTAALNERGEPRYGPRDVPDLAAIRALGRPFWLAGSQACPERLAAARAAGAEGVQIGTAFAFCEESGLAPELKTEVLARCRRGEAEVFTDPRVSPTGLPFKVVKLPGTLSEDAVYEARERRCDVGLLRQPYRRPDGLVGYRCAAEPVDHYVAKGGEDSATEGRKCLCNGLLAAAGFAQRRGAAGAEPAIVTAGTEVAELTRFLADGRSGYGATDVLRHLATGFVQRPVAAPAVAAADSRPA